MPYCNVQSFKKWKFWEFGPLIKHGPSWIKFFVLTFIIEHNRYLKYPYKIWSKFISFDMKKKGKSKTCHKFYEERVEFGGVLGVSPYVSNGVPQLYLDPSSHSNKL
jgi:hypothetical protein